MIFRGKEGVGYLEMDLTKPNLFFIHQWLESQEILSLYQSWREYALDGMNWLWRLRNPEGLWDIGNNVSKTYYFPLSDNWRRRGNRQVDHSTRVLALLRKIYNGGFS